MTEWLAEIERRSGGGDVPAQMRQDEPPWQPAILANVPPAALRDLRYVVVDDVDHTDGDVVIVSEPWPTVDMLGRVRHATADAVEQYVAVARWHALLKRRRIPAEVAERPPRIGDAFAMMLPRSGDVLKPKGPVVDVTADAREAARAAFYGAVALPMAPAHAEALRAPETATPLVVDAPEEWL